MCEHSRNMELEFAAVAVNALRTWRYNVSAEKRVTDLFDGEGHSKEYLDEKIQLEIKDELWSCLDMAQKRKYMDLAINFYAFGQYVGGVPGH